MILLAAIALIFIGPQQLPQLAKILGKTIAELKKAAAEVTSSVVAEATKEEVKKEPSPAEEKKEES